MIRAPASQRFWAKVDRPDDDAACWVWTAAKVTGYGRFRDETGKQVSAHRWAYELIVGPIPEGLQLDHLCRNRACVNPDHLEPVSSAVNVHRSPIARAAVNARKTHCGRGHPLSGDNLVVSSRGERTCRTCRNALAAVRARNRTLQAGRVPGRGGYQAARTHCPRGHAYTAENTYRSPSQPNKRVCRICKREKNRLAKQRARDAGTRAP